MASWGAKPWRSRIAWPSGERMQRASASARAWFAPLHQPFIRIANLRRPLAVRSAGELLRLRVQRRETAGSQGLGLAEDIPGVIAGGVGQHAGMRDAGGGEQTAPPALQPPGLQQAGGAKIVATRRPSRASNACASSPSAVSGCRRRTGEPHLLTAPPSCPWRSLSAPFVSKSPLLMHRASDQGREPGRKSARSNASHHGVAESHLRLCICSATFHGGGMHNTRNQRGIPATSQQRP